MRIFKYILFGFLFCSFFGVQHYLPFLQKQIPRWQAEELGGSRFSEKKPNFWPWTWMDGSFQKAYQKYLKNENDLNASFVRANTQLNFELFGEIPHEDIMMGKENYLMPKSSWIAAYGRDYIGAEKINEYIDQLQVINNYLKNRNQRLLILTPPNKTTALSEYLPDYYRNAPKHKNNRESFRAAFQETGLDYIAFDHFVNTKDDHDYPLYPQGGLHWTYYGYTLAADTLRNYIENQFDWDLPTMKWRDSIELKKNERHSDIELYASANFLHLPKLDPLPYPNIRYDRDSADLIKVLAVGDSYYKLLYDYGIHNGLFHEEAPFWYYASTLFPPVYRDGKKLNNSGDLDALEVLEGKDLVILTVVEGNLKNFGWGWVKRVHDAIEREKTTNN